MVSKKKITISWSGGKDSAFALYKIQSSGDYNIVHLHTVIDEGTRRVGLHGVREELIEKQAEYLGLPLVKIYLPASEDHDAYEKIMRTFYRQCAKEGVEGIVFGDIFLEDLKAYREKLLNESKLTPLFPLWKIDSHVLLHDFVNSGFRTVLCSANAALFSKDQVGKTVDESFVSSLTAGVDCCGENGEFHTFVYDGPVFKKRVPFTLGEVVERKYSYQKQNEDGTREKLETTFLFQDLLPRMA